MLAPLFLSACLMLPRDINEDYLSVACAEKADGSLQVNAQYMESAWGFDNMHTLRDGDRIYILGKLKFEALGMFKTTLKVPGDVSEVYFCSKKIWSRNSE